MVKFPRQSALLFPLHLVKTQREFLWRVDHTISTNFSSLQAVIRATVAHTKCEINNLMKLEDLQINPSFYALQISVTLWISLLPTGQPPPMIVRPFENSQNEFSWKTVDTAIPKKLYRPPCRVWRYFATNWMRNSMFHQLKGFMNLLALSMHFGIWRSFLFIEIMIYTRRLFTLVRYCYISRMLWIAHYKDLICDKHKY